MDFLSKIIATRRVRIEEARRPLPIEGLREQATEARRSAKQHALRDVLSNGEVINIIAEFKRRSPSKGTIREDADPATIARSYQTAGAAAISVLTEQDYFAGSIEDLRAVRDVVSIPVLRKDFIVDEFQIYEAAAAGADALLLIVAALDDENLERLLRLTEAELGLDALVEVHTKAELDRAVANRAKLIGVNNRDLRTFEVSTETSLQLARYAAVDTLLVSESGLSPGDIAPLQAAGYRGFLIGEALMRANDPGRELQLFLDSV